VTCLGIVDETEHPWHPPRTARYPAEADLVAVNRIFDLSAGEAATHQNFQRGNGFGGMFYRGGDGEEHGLLFWHDLRQGALQHTDDPQGHLVEPQAEISATGQFGDILLDVVRLSGLANGLPQVSL